MITWDEIKKVRDSYLKAIGWGSGTVPEWFKGAGIGFDAFFNCYTLVVNVREPEDVHVAQDVLKQITYAGVVEIKVVGDIVAL